MKFIGWVQSKLNTKSNQQTTSASTVNCPGCSSLGGGAFSELGPFFPRGDGRGLIKKSKSWNKGPFFPRGIVVGFLGLLSAILGFAAEGKRIKGAQVIRDNNNPSVCIYPRTPAFGLGLGAAVCLLIAQMIVNIQSCCICCCKRYVRSSGNHFQWTLAVVCFVVSWMTFVLAFLLLLGGAALNDQHNMDSMYLNNYCYVVKPGVFAGAAALFFISVTLGLKSKSMVPRSREDAFFLNSIS